MHPLLLSFLRPSPQQETDSIRYRASPCAHRAAWGGRSHAGSPDGQRHPVGGTLPAPEQLPSLHNCTGGDWSRLRSCDQGKRAEEGNDELVNHALQTTQAPTPVSATSPSLPDSSVGGSVSPGSSSARILASAR